MVSLLKELIEIKRHTVSLHQIKKEKKEKKRAVIHKIQKNKHLEEKYDQSTTSKSVLLYVISYANTQESLDSKDGRHPERYLPHQWPIGSAL